MRNLKLIEIVILAAAALLAAAKSVIAFVKYIDKIKKQDEPAEYAAQAA